MAAKIVASTSSVSRPAPGVEEGANGSHDALRDWLVVLDQASQRGGGYGSEGSLVK